MVLRNINERANFTDLPATAVSYNIIVSRNVTLDITFKLKSPRCTQDKTAIQHLLGSPWLCCIAFEQCVCWEEIP